MAGTPSTPSKPTKSAEGGPPVDDINQVLDKFRKEEKGEDSDDDLSDEEQQDENGNIKTSKRRKPFVDRPLFNSLVGAVIVLNALTIGLETDARSAAKDGHSVSGLWYILEVVFCILFLTELVLRLYYHKIAYFTTSPMRGWNIIDFSIVVVSLADTFILMPIGFGGTARFVSMLRFVRLMRLVRLVRLFRIFKELWLVANGLLNVIRTLMWICLLIFIVCYICAIFCTQWIGHNDELYDPYFIESGGWDHEQYFNTVMTSVFTLLQFVTLDQWSDNIARHVIKNQPGMLIFFVVFICMTAFCILNIIVGVVVENAISTASKDQLKLRKSKEKDRQMVFNQLRDIFEEADTDSSGTLDLDEVEVAISKPEIYNKLRMIDFPVADPQQIFVLLDYDDSGELTIEEFITGCMRMKGSAKSKDLLVAQTALNTMKIYYQQFEKELHEFETKLGRLDVTMRAIIEHGEHVFLDIRQYRMRHPSEQGGDIPRMDSSKLYEAPWEKPDMDFPSPPVKKKMPQDALADQNDHKPENLAIVKDHSAVFRESVVAPVLDGVRSLMRLPNILRRNSVQAVTNSTPTGAIEDQPRTERAGSKGSVGSKDRAGSRAGSKGSVGSSPSRQQRRTNSKTRAMPLVLMDEPLSKNQLAIPGQVRN